MEFSDNLYMLFRQSLEGKSIAEKPAVSEELSSLEMFFYIEQNQRVIPFACDKIYICEPQKGNLSFGDRQQGTMHALLVYNDKRWYITATNKQVDVWLSGIRLKYGQRYLVRSGDQIMMKEMISFTVQCHPNGISSQNRIEEMLDNLERDIMVYARSKRSDRVAYGRIMDYLLHIPLFCWGGFAPSSDNGEMASFIQAIPANRGRDWQPTTDIFNEINMGTGELLCVPVFTSEEHAIKGGCPLGAFPYDFPLPIFNQIAKLDIDVVINPFSEYSVTIPKGEVKALWVRIQELNNVTDCPAPDWRMHSKLAMQMLDVEDNDDNF